VTAVSPVSRVAVAIPVPLDKAFHYSVPASLETCVRTGQLVSVPFGRRALAGVIVELDPQTREEVELKPIGSLLTDTPVLTEEEIRFLRWVSRYYRHALGQVVSTALPPLVRNDRGDDGIARPVAWRAPVVKTVKLRQNLTATMSAFSRPGPVRDRMLAYLDRFGEVEVARLHEQFSGAGRVLTQLRDLELVEIRERPQDPQDAFAGDEAGLAEEESAPPTLTDEQRDAVGRIHDALTAGAFAPVLLHGVTGSGKTEVYLRAAEETLAAGGGVLVLVPEIALTPQLVGRFAQRLGVPMAVLHSNLTRRQRLERWRGLREGAARVAIGARSTVFAPVADLKLIVVDEEHDGSYKQEDGLRYNARDVAVMRASQTGAVCVLGSATPSLESLHNGRTDRYATLSLTHRVLDRPMPDVTVVDLREERGEDDQESHRLLTPTLLNAVSRTVERDEQAILLLNRRGLSTMVVCGGCGGSFRCSDCDTSLTYHGRRNQLSCHYCGRSKHLPDRCPNCGEASLELLGQGTERIEEGLAELIPGLRVDRMDRDTTSDRGAHARILDRFRSGDIQVLVGTQMVAKGHDFPRVTLVGVLHADAGLNLPDFRAGERTFSLLTQVAGRAGRAELAGRVIVQTFTPEAEAIRFALSHDYSGYAEHILRKRQALGYPPFGRLAMIRFSHVRPDRARRAAQTVGDALRNAIRARNARQLRMLGPSPAPLQRLAGRFRWRLILLAPDPRTLAALLDAAEPALQKASRESGVRLAVDVDPQSML
jgi:primosomal protein N' (replication factor Y) (superfamily II helicase)